MSIKPAAAPTAADVNAIHAMNSSHNHDDVYLSIRQGVTSSS